MKINWAAVETTQEGQRVMAECIRYAELVRQPIRIAHFQFVSDPQGGQLTLVWSTEPVTQ